ESELARRFGVSRPTVREALRSLAAQRLIRTTKGPGGGNFVTPPTVRTVSELLESGLSLIATAEEGSLDEFLEVREVLETRAAGPPHPGPPRPPPSDAPPRATTPRDRGSVRAQPRLSRRSAHRGRKHTSLPGRPADFPRAAEQPRPLGARRQSASSDQRPTPRA